ncbi:4'-phosphopantetheinyl transferase superfamily protein [Streptomyces sp. NPDC050610]|uniref:4'-phosphopantetheinyl transferase family protein n=1 Tax=Streptomyces sp. NPDC050610 TaxID=3157097 RepID=UPI003413A681
MLRTHSRALRGLRLWHGTAARTEPSAEDWAEDWAVLSPEEQQRAHRFMRSAETGHYVHAHARVRRIMAGLLDCPPGAIRFGREPCPGCGDAGHGRPRVAAPATALRFNHSRSEAAWLLAVAPEGQRVGADVERIRPLGAFAGLIDSCLAPDERDYVTGAADPVRRRLRFYRCWVRKEAVLKAVGTGLAGGLARLDVRPAETGAAVVRVDGPGAGRFLVQDIPLGRGLAAAVAGEVTGDRAEEVTDDRAEELAADCADSRACDRADSRVGERAALFGDSSERTVPEFINGADEMAGRAG